MQGSDSYRLIVRRGPQPNQVYELDKEVINLGRDITNDIVINDREVSRHHLRLTHGASGYTIEDSGSTNGTFVNGKRITGATPLKNGDMVGLGETVTLGYELVRPEGQAASSSPASGATMPSPSGQPYQPAPQPEPKQPEPYQPPQQAPQQSANPYQQPQPYQAPQEPYQAEPYGQQDAYPQDAYQQPAYGDQQAYGDQGYYQAQGNYGPPPSGYDYDPYAIRDEEGGGAARWILYGCIGLMVFCCCVTILAAVAVDTLCLYDSIPFLGDILRAIGLPPTC